MERKSIAQEYFALASDANGNMPPMRRDESNAGMVAACIMDLLLNNVIAMERTKITVLNDIPTELIHLTSLYKYLMEKPRSTEKLMSDYYLDSRIKQLANDIGESLFTDGVATKGKGGIFGPKTTYITEKSYKDQLIDDIKAAVKKEDVMTPHDTALIFILNETENLNQYFSKYESQGFKSKLKEMKKNPQNRQLAEMINYISDITAIITFWVLTNPV